MKKEAHHLPWEGISDVEDVSRIERDRASYDGYGPENSFKIWSEEDYDIFLKLANQGVSNEEIAVRLKRSERAVILMIKELNYWG